MLVPVIKKIIKSNNVLMERSLPGPGRLNVKVGDKVEPFTKLGMSKISYKVMRIGAMSELIIGKSWKEFFYAGEKIGTINSKSIIAPFDGYLVIENDDYYLKEEEKSYWLLSGVWGSVVNILEEKSVLLKGQMTDIHFSACSSHALSGELVVFPNPSDILEMQYLEKFEKYAFGKIIYVGNLANSEILEKASKMGIAGIIAGGADKSVFITAKKNKIFLGLFSAFGNAPTPKFIFDVLKEVSNRYVFIQGEKNLLRIPMPESFKTTKKKPSVLRQLKKEMIVVVLQDPYFGWMGIVDSIKGSSIFIKLSDNGEVVETSIPNILILE